MCVIFLSGICYHVVISHNKSYSSEYKLVCYIEQMYFLTISSGLKLQVCLCIDQYNILNNTYVNLVYLLLVKVWFEIFMLENICGK